MKHYVDLPVFYRAPEGTDGGGGDDNKNTPGDDNGAVAGTSAGGEDVAKLIEKAVADAVAGLRKKNEEVIGDNKKLKDQINTLKSKPALSDDEYSEFKSLKERMERDEFLKALAEGKSEEVIEKVTRKTKLDYEAKLAAEAEARTKTETEANAWRARYEETLINAEIKSAAAGSVKPQYQDLVARLVGDRVKLVDGAVRVVNSDGDIEMSVNGTKPLAVSELVESLRATYTDLFLTSTGGGTTGSTKRGSGTTSNKIAVEVASTMSVEDYMKARAEGRI
jgi:hypothetical protein